MIPDSRKRLRETSGELKQLGYENAHPYLTWAAACSFGVAQTDVWSRPESIALANARTEALIAPAISGCERTPAWSSSWLQRGSVIDASGTTLAIITVSVSIRDARACVERGDALISATGLPYNSPLLTTQLSTFLRAPGTPWAYSGLEIKTPSAA
jgi:hypothetical protein